ncbi:MAG: glycosyltransferase 87 family protein, partial [Gemmataceae bacterium]|nr:glycosyltransferase 87 family protein [Gemmataceae bacterium]
WLAAATCLKVIPALLVLYPLMRRDGRMLAHFGLGLVSGLVLVPLAALGPERTLSTARAFAANTLLPGLTSDGGKLAAELTNMTATDNQSLQAIIHNARHPDRATRPATADVGTKLAHVGLSAALVGWTFVAAGRFPDPRRRVYALLAGLAIVMVAATPVNHTHYMVLAVPAVLGLVHAELERRRVFGWGAGLTVVAAVHLASGVLPRLPFVPGFELLRDLGVTMLGTLVVWYAALTRPVAPAVTPSRLNA